MSDPQQEERACENLCVSAQTPAGLATTEAVVHALPGKSLECFGCEEMSSLRHGTYKSLTFDKDSAVPKSRI
jgi:hypothetical protein